MRILVAEDDRATLVRLISHIRSWGHEVISAVDGEDAWKLYEEGDFDMVITDWLMPKLDGLELLKRLRASKEGSYIYTILLTSRSEKSDVVTGIESGADDFVSKPFDKDELRARIHAAQRIIELEQALEEHNRQLAKTNAGLTMANQRMMESLQAAARIQQSFLPAQAPDSSFAEFAWVCEPCEELGGDTLNIVPLDEDHLGIYIIDVSGHGVPAALLSVHLSRILTRLDGSDSLVRRWCEREECYEIVPPAEVIAGLNRRFAYDEQIQQYFTALYGVLELSGRRFRYTSAGHPGPLVVSRGKGELRRASPPAVGLLPDGEFVEQELDCRAGDRLFFYTDGVFEVENHDQEQFGQERMRELMEDAAHEPLKDSLERMRNAVWTWSNGKPIEDDLSLIGVQIC